MAASRIVLIGFMGSGKSSVAKELSHLLSLPALDLDELIEESAELSIPEIFSKFGEPHFRELEREAAWLLAEEREILIASGGGVVEYPETMRALGVKGLPPATAMGGQGIEGQGLAGTEPLPTIFVYLKTSFEQVLARLTPDGRGLPAAPRPLFEDLEKARERYDRRLALYEKYANLTVETDEISAHEVARLIAQKV